MKQKILITNDDGIHSPGIRALCEALIDIAEVSVVAPDEEQSGKGLGITIHEPIEIAPYSQFGSVPAWKVSGTPADCVKMGLSVLLSEPPTMIVSGVNNSPNSGRNVLYSGTIGGTIEGALRGIPGIAFSSIDDKILQYHHLKDYIQHIVHYFVQHPMPFGTIINVNFPAVEREAIKGLKLARQGQSYYLDDPNQTHHETGEISCDIGSRWVAHDEHHNSDVALLADGYITAVPIHVNEMTDHTLLSTHEEKFEDFFQRHFPS